ncbi:glutathione S-transferase N-terminal domain-containing protein [Rhizobium sp. XQZ8]|uniref:glutathione S-transferase family protein n=1 Tax=Rhizobium populisoli TaxID=2859785 RepID=UPI001CA5B5B6|nr:glutathione S-transferase N-terminal domain-containing protein [Rhizobium populisoli]MBW6425844.1 glutathione S-transferase N-terminal domain-containing protein [Rhizobium populisoli]
MENISSLPSGLADLKGKTVLFYSPGACSLASHIALEETGKPFRPVETLLGKQQHLSENYLAINPRGKVPALVTADGEVLTENTAILTYVALSNPDARLIPTRILDQARCIAQMAWFSNTPHIFQKAKFRPYHFADREEVHGDIREKAATRFWECLIEIDQMIGDQTWIMGQDYTVVDPYAFVFFGWGKSNGLPMETLLNFSRHKDQMLERPAVRTVLEREQNPHFQTYLAALR